MNEITRTSIRIRWIPQLPWPWRTVTIVTAPTGVWLETGYKLYGPYGPCDATPAGYTDLRRFTMTPMKRPDRS